MTHIAQMNARIASLSAALQQIADLTTPGANSTNKKMAGIAVAALEANQTPIEIVETDRHSRPSANKNYFTVAQVIRTARIKSACDDIHLLEADGGWTMAFDQRNEEGVGFYKESFVEGRLNHKAKEDWVALLVRFAEECEDEIDQAELANTADEPEVSEEVNEEVMAEA